MKAKKITTTLRKGFFLAVLPSFDVSFLSILNNPSNIG
jgi:hypothetical protein